MNILFLFSLFDSDDPLLALVPVSSAMRDCLILFGAIFLVVFLMTAGMLLRRARKQRRHSLHRTAAGVAELNKTTSKRPRRRRAHRSRNPTLAETGGLPPVRSTEPIDPPQPRTQLQ